MDVYRSSAVITLRVHFSCYVYMNREETLHEIYESNSYATDFCFEEYNELS